MHLKLNNVVRAGCLQPEDMTWFPTQRTSLSSAFIYSISFPLSKKVGSCDGRHYYSNFMIKDIETEEAKQSAHGGPKTTTIFQRNAACTMKGVRTPGETVLWIPTPLIGIWVDLEMLLHISELQWPQSCNLDENAYVTELLGRLNEILMSSTQCLVRPQEMTAIITNYCVGDHHHRYPALLPLQPSTPVTHPQCPAHGRDSLRAWFSLSAHLPTGGADTPAVHSAKYQFFTVGVYSDWATVHLGWLVTLLF